MVAAVVSVGILFIVGPAGLFAGLIAAVALSALRDLVPVVDRSHGPRARLADRATGLGDPVRLVGFFGAFIGYAVVSVVVVVLLVRPLVG